MSPSRLKVGRTQKRARNSELGLRGIERAPGGIPGDILPIDLAFSILRPRLTSFLAASTIGFFSCGLITVSKSW
jgi:hypothetical protein